MNFLKRRSFYLGVLTLLILLILIMNIKQEKVDYSKFDNKNQFDQIKCKDCNVLMISLTNLRADHLNLYGYERKTSPNIDALAERSIVFNNFFSHASWTLPVGMSLFTSLYPFEHKIMNRGIYYLNPKLNTFVDVLNNNNYSTAAFTGNKDYGEEYKLITKFDQYKSFNNDEDITRWMEYGVFSKTVPAAMDWLNINKNKKFFLFVQSYDLHCPFTVPKKNDMFSKEYHSDLDFNSCLWTFDTTNPIVVRKNDLREEVYYVEDDFKNKQVLLNNEDVQHMIALYDGEIINSDKQISKLLQQLVEFDLINNTIVVIYSEHGDMFGKHGRFMRGGPLRGTFFDDVLHVPLIIYHPKYNSKKIDGLSQIIDLAPTLLDMLNLDLPKSWSGKSLIPLITKNKTINKFVFAGSEYTPRSNNSFFNKSSRISMIRDLNWKLIKEKIFGEKVEEKIYFFNLNEDPEELNSLNSKKEQKKFDFYEKKLEEWEIPLIIKEEESERGYVSLKNVKKCNSQKFNIEIPSFINVEEVNFKGLEVDEYKLTGMFLVDFNNETHAFLKCKKNLQKPQLCHAIKISENEFVFKKNIFKSSENGLGTPSAIVINDSLYLYFREDFDNGEKVSLLISKDLKKWSYHPEIFKGKKGSWDESSISGMHIVPFEKKYHMYYRGSKYLNQMESEIGLATSDDGFNWERYSEEPIMKKSINGWDKSLLADPHIIKNKNYFYMFYSGHDRHEIDVFSEKDHVGKNKKIGFAISKDGFIWERCSSQPFLDLEEKTDNPFVFFENSLLNIYFRTSNIIHYEEFVRGGKIKLAKFKFNSHIT